MSSAKDVRHVSTTKVRPASYIGQETDNYQRIDLNPFHLVFLSGTYMQKGLMFTNSQSLPKQQQKEDGANDECISDKINEKHEDDNTISVYINSNFEGVDFIHATADISAEDILSPTFVPQSIIDSLIPFNGVTELSDGALFIGCSANHSVCDGASIWHFIHSWSAISRSLGDHTSSPLPVFERWFIKETDCPIRLPFSFAEKF
ncbi:hypothetical protein C5167_014864 [Papaver somniferum]|uniref:Acetyltransferase n=1 Tax=Papaver somniferum TaxID=3469 RepID=A0A4Y7J7H8_PAPSO|nr:hypothetical protein C5167_014864 [Papaver somniferum]